MLYELHVKKTLEALCINLKSRREKTNFTPEVLPNETLEHIKMLTPEILKITPEVLLRR